ncbi:MAG: DUF4331 domain-containing protein [Planctomycetes bacterium]|nr:DUF4331 domain-containing protein [Planctomycetota bacterium]
MRVRTLLPAGVGLFAVCSAFASSHREAPLVTEMPKVDGTDFYMFRSYEAGHDDSVILIANYQPLQDAYGGPNYFFMDPEARYEIHVDNDGDAREDLTFRFRFDNALKPTALDVGAPGQTKSVAIPLVTGIGAVSAADATVLNLTESFTVDVVRTTNKGKKSATSVAHGSTGALSFAKPVDHIGTKTIPDYAAYAAAHVVPIALPNGFSGRMFVGQRDDPFVVNLGQVFDQVNIANPIGAPNAVPDRIEDANVTSFVLEIPIAFLVDGDETVIGGWTTASLPKNRVLRANPTFEVPTTEKTKGKYVQVSRLGMPLVNEVIIGLPDKDRFNASQPKDDAQFLDYVTHPTLPEILGILFAGAGVEAPNVFPRTDLIAAFLTGLDGVNQPAGVKPAEMLRLNTATAPTPKANQNRLGLLGSDAAGFPNGRRLGDDVVDIELRVAMGVLIGDAQLAPSGALPFTDAALVDASMFGDTFPFVNDPFPGSP